jgi:hypothetical protein
MVSGTFLLAASLVATKAYLPPYPPTWQLNKSTIVMSCQFNGTLDPSQFGGWAIQDYDWSNMLDQWSDAVPMTTDESLLKQVELTKAAQPDAKTWIYRAYSKDFERCWKHAYPPSPLLLSPAFSATPLLPPMTGNSVYAYPCVFSCTHWLLAGCLIMRSLRTSLTAPLSSRPHMFICSWYTSVRTILDDPAYAPWFLMFKPEGPWYSPKCDNFFSPPLCSDFFHTQMDTPRPDGKGYGTCHPPAGQGCNCGTKPCGFFVFNHSSDAVVNGQTFPEWFVSTYMFNEIGLNPLVNGFFCACSFCVLLPSPTPPPSLCCSLL